MKGSLKKEMMMSDKGLLYLFITDIIINQASKVMTSLISFISKPLISD